MERKDDIGFKVRELTLAIKHARQRCGGDPVGDECTPPGKLTRIQGWVLGYLYEHRGEDVYQRDIERRFSVRRPTMSAILQVMEKNGLIERRRDERDARLKKITLTPDALEIHEFHERDIADFEQTMRKGISDEELGTFFAVIEKIKANIEACGTSNS